MLSVAFSGLDSEAATLSEVIDGDFQNGDIIQVYNKDGGGYWFYTYENGEWLDENFDPATKLFPAGTAFWIKTQNPTTKVTLKGTVIKGEYTQKCPQGMSMIATGVPVDLPLNGGIKWVGLNNADRIQIKNGNSYLFYTYENGQWLDEEFNPTTAIISAGTSVWVQTQGSDASLTVQGAK